MILGCVADDFTGASDAASLLREGGAEVVLCNGIPAQNSDVFSRTQAVVIAQKTRTAPKNEAVESSMNAFRWLKKQGAQTLYFKYCSTFDSTEHGNIGPVLDALLEETGVSYTLICPTLLANGRTVRDGILYVNGVPLGESPMKAHPLTPMRDSRLKVLMERQSQYPCRILPEAEFDTWQPDMMTEHFYLIPDYYEEQQGEHLVRRFGKHPVLSGGSGLLKPLAKTWECKCEKAVREISGIPERTVILAGSCSETTRKQICAYQKTGGASFRIHPLEYAEGRQTKEDIKEFISGHSEETVLIYSSAKPEEVEEIKSRWKKEYGALDSFNENILAQMAVYALEAGRKNIIVAGGETSGAVIGALGFQTFEVGKTIAPGVPVMYPVDRMDVKIALKSGNFGEEDFFRHAEAMMQRQL